jgi:hypothetical protein
VKPKPPTLEKNLGRDLDTFEQLPAKTKELELLQDRAEKTSGPENVAIHKKIRAKSK